MGVSASTPQIRDISDASLAPTKSYTISIPRQSTHTERADLESIATALQRSFADARADVSFFAETEPSLSMQFSRTDEIRVSIVRAVRARRAARLDADGREISVAVPLATDYNIVIRGSPDFTSQAVPRVLQTIRSMQHAPRFAESARDFARLAQVSGSLRPDIILAREAAMARGTASPSIRAAVEAERAVNETTRQALQTFEQFWGAQTVRQESQRFGFQAPQLILRDTPDRGPQNAADALRRLALT